MVFVLNVWVRVRKERKQARRLRQSERAKATEENRVSQKYISESLWKIWQLETGICKQASSTCECLIETDSKTEPSFHACVSSVSLHYMIWSWQLVVFFSVRLLALLSYLNKKQTWDVTNGANKKIHIYALAWNRVMVNSASRTQSVKYPNMPIGTTLRQIATFQWKTRREWIRAAR